MPKVKVNPNAKAPEFVAVQPGEYQMKFERLEKDACKQSEKGNWYTKMRLVHQTPSEQLTSLLTGHPLKNEVASSVFVTFMMDPEQQGTLRQAIEATGQEWPQDPDFELDENWIQDSLDQRPVVVRLKTSQYQGNWKNEVARFITPE